MDGGHYVIAISQPPERRPLERRTLAPILNLVVNPNYTRPTDQLHLLLGLAQLSPILFLFSILT